MLDGLSLAIAPGEVVALLGRSGAGKSTILRLVNRMLLPTRGSVLVEGRDTRAWDPILLRRRIGYVLQEGGLFPHMSVADNVAVVPRLEGWLPADVDTRVHDLLELVGLPAARFATRWPEELSGGQRQRVGVARALAADPPVLLMDEPFGALDPITRAELQQETARLQQRLRKTILLVTHDVEEALLLSDRICIIDDGRLQACVAAGAFDAADDPVIAALRDARLRAPAEPPDVMEVIRFWLEHRAEVLALMGQHVLLAGLSTLVATAVGVPLGIAAAHRPKFNAPLVGLANAVQTVPSLAMFGFLLPLPLLGGIGSRTAIVALTLYALLPILRTTITGITGIDRAVRDAGVALGMTPRQLLWQVEVPLAIPSIVSGVRIAAVVAVGSATIAAAVGAGGLGEYIYRGLAMVDTTVILAGAIPAAGLAMLVDLGLWWVQRHVARRRTAQRPPGAPDRRRRPPRCRPPDLGRVRLARGPTSSSWGPRTSPSSSCSARSSRRPSSATRACASIGAPTSAARSSAIAPCRPATSTCTSSTRGRR